MMKSAPKSICLTLVLLSLIATTVLCASQESENAPLINVRAYLSHETIRPGDAFKVAVVASIKKGFHINSNTPADEFLVPTVLEFGESEAMLIGPPAYPVPALVSLGFSKKKVSVYEGAVSIYATGRVAQDAIPGEITVSGELAYQACNDTACFMPETIPFEKTFRIVAPDAETTQINQDIFEKKPELSVFEAEAKRTVEGGMVHALWAFFLFGLGLNLTPCVYPVIPMTVGFFGNQRQQKKAWTIFLALIYVLGIAIVFSALGLISGLAGKQWGFLFQSPWFVITIAIAILAMAASMFGAFEITIPSFLMQLGGKSRQGVVGAFVMGLTVGVVIAPCAAGIVLGLVGIIAKLGMVWKGALFFFVLGVGLGFPYLFLAVSSSLMTHLPQSGMWMVWVRKFFGILLIGVAVYFLVPQGKQVADQESFYLGVLGIFGGLFLGFLDSSEGYKRTFKLIRAAVGCLIIIGGVTLVNQALHPEKEGVSWVHSVEDFRSEGKPLVMDFYADWCAACKELDRNTFSDKKVIEAAKEFVMVRVDLTTPNATNSVLRKKFKITGLPTVVFVGTAGLERKDLRVVGFVGPEDMRERMDAILKE